MRDEARSGGSGAVRTRRGRLFLGRWCASVVVGVLLGAVDPAVRAEAPVVQRVEPPSWWLGHTRNPLRLLLTGRHLDQATLQAPTGFTVSNPRSSASGDYLFADLGISAEATAGEHKLQLTTPGGRVAVPFRLMEQAEKQSRSRGFSTEDVIYLILPDRFANGDLSNDDPPQSRGLLDRGRPRHYHGGDFKGIQDRLPYLRDLGVTTLWLTPWYDNVNRLNQREKYTLQNQLSPHGMPSTDYHGYGAVDFYGVEERFGTMHDLLGLLQAARQQGLRVIQDQVANHTGPYHPWATNPPTPTWFNGTVTQHLANSWQIWTTTATNPPSDLLKSTLEGWFLNLLPDLNQNDAEVASYLIQNSLWWVGMTGVDAVRQDTLPYVPRTYWARWTVALKREHPDLTILGELFDANPSLVSFFQGGRVRFDGVDTGVDTLFDFPLYYAIRDVFGKGKSMIRIEEALAADTNYVRPGVLVTFLGLHDTDRFMEESGASLDGLCRAFTFLLTSRGTPLIYYGDEIGMNGGKDPNNRKDFPGGWRDDAQSAFDPAGRTPRQESVHRHVKKLLALRSELAALRHGAQQFLHADATVCAFERVLLDSGVLVVMNNDSRERELELKLTHPLWNSVTTLTDRLGELGVVHLDGGRLKLQVPAGQAGVLVPDLALVRSDP